MAGGLSSDRSRSRSRSSPPSSGSLTPPRSGGYYGGAPPRAPYAPQGNYPTQPPASVALTTQQDPALSGLASYGSGQMQGVDPLLAEAAQNYRNRMSSDTTQRAIGIAGGAVDDSLASAMQRAKEEANIQGTASGSQIQRAQGLTDQSERLKAGQAATIALGSEARLDQLAGGFASTAGAAGAQRLGWGGLAAGAAGAGAANQISAQQTQISAAQLAAQQQAAQQQAMLNAYNLAYA